MTLPTGARRVREAFARARSDGRVALATYLMAGHPNERAALDAADAALRAGADMLEIGVPFSDPVADGPVIEAAGHSAVAAGAGLDTVLRTVAALRHRGHEQPVLAMGYLNPFIAASPSRALGRLAEAGVDALIIPDLPAGEDRHLERLTAAAGLGLAFLVAPNTPPERIERTVRASTAFVYVVPLFGVTGARDRVAAAAGPLLRRVQGIVARRLPVAVGFGVSAPEHVRELAPLVDGVIVGSAVVAASRDGGPPQVASLVASLSGATALQST